MKGIQKTEEDPMRYESSHRMSEGSYSDDGEEMAPAPGPPRMSLRLGDIISKLGDDDEEQGDELLTRSMISMHLSASLPDGNLQLQSPTSRVEKYLFSLVFYF